MAKRFSVLAMETVVLLTVAGTAASGVAASLGGSRVMAGTSVAQYVVVLKPGADRAAAEAEARALGGDVFMQYSHALNGFAVRIPATALNGLERSPRVEFVEPDSEFTAAAAPPTCPLDTRSGFPTQCVPPGAARIGAEESSTRSGNGRSVANVNVAVLDSGVDASHPDLHVVGGTTCTNDKLAPTSDPGGHGTAVAGIIGADDNGFGVVGVAPGANLYSVRVLDKNLVGNISMVLCGVDWVTGTRTDTDPNNDIAVANMSLGAKGSNDGNCGRSNKDALHLAICNSVAAGVTYVVSAGNSSADLKDFVPASYDEVLTATAMSDFDGQPGGLYAGTHCGGTDDTAASFSNFATLIPDQAHTVGAPGVCVVSTVPVGWFLPDFATDYGIWTGTSFSSPHVAGTVALCIAESACAGLSPPQIVQTIVSDARSYNSTHTSYGYQGDPVRPFSGKYYGYLINTSTY